MFTCHVIWYFILKTGILNTAFATSNTLIRSKEWKKTTKQQYENFSIKRFEKCVCVGKSVKVSSAPQKTRACSDPMHVIWLKMTSMYTNNTKPPDVCVIFEMHAKSKFIKFRLYVWFIRRTLVYCNELMREVHNVSKSTREIHRVKMHMNLWKFTYLNGKVATFLGTHDDMATKI